MGRQSEEGLGQWVTFDVPLVQRKVHHDQLCALKTSRKFEMSKLNNWIEKERTLYFGKREKIPYKGQKNIESSPQKN